MRHRKHAFSSGRRSHSSAWLLFLILLVLFLLSGIPGCMARTPYTARGTMIFLPDGGL